MHLFEPSLKLIFFSYSNLVELRKADIQTNESVQPIIFLNSGLFYQVPSPTYFVCVTAPLLYIGPHFQPTATTRTDDNNNSFIHYIYGIITRLEMIGDKENERYPFLYNRCDCYCDCTTLLCYLQIHTIHRTTVFVCTSVYVHYNNIYIQNMVCIIRTHT